MANYQDPLLRYSRWFQKLADLLFDPEKYTVLSTWGERIGHTSFEIMMAVSISNRNEKKIIFIAPFKSVNKEILNCEFNCPTYDKTDWKVCLLKSALNVSLFFHYFYNGIRSKILIILPFLSKIIPSIFFYPCYGFEKGVGGLRRLRGAQHYWDCDLLLLQKHKVTLNSRQLSKGNALREQMKIPKDSWFVCLHVREQGYLGEMHAYNIRSSSISNYLSAIRYITKKGGYVVRMGDPSMTTLPLMERVIDYANSGIRSELMDIYLASKCRFFIGCESGLYSLAWLFQKPICLINITSFVAAFPNLPNHLAIPKNVYSLKKQKFLTLKELLSSEIHSDFSEYIFVENTPEEILETIKEYLMFLERGRFNGSDDLQNEVRKVRRLHHEYLLKQDDTKETFKDSLLGTMSVKGRIGSFYLDHHWGNTQYLEKLNKLYGSLPQRLSE